MSANVVNQVAYLSTTRLFPKDPDLLVVELTKSYIDIANSINSRIISIFPTVKPAINGEQWFIKNNQRQQGFRQVYTITGAGNYPHGITVSTIAGFVKIYGTFTDGTNWYPLPYVSIAGGVASQVQLIVDSTNIQVNAGAGAPTISSGFVVLEWLSVP